MVSGDTFKRFSRTLGAAPTTTSHLGSVFGAYTYNGTTTNGDTAAQVSLSISTAGVYLFNFSCDWNSVGSIVTSCSCQLVGTGKPVANTFFQGGPANTTGAFNICGSCVISCTVSTYSLSTVTWTGGPATAAFVPLFSFFQATRIG